MDLGGAGTGYWLRQLCPRGSGEKRWSHPGKRPKLGENQGVASPGLGQQTSSMVPLLHSPGPVHTGKCLDQVCSRKMSLSQEAMEEQGEWWL